MTKEMATFRRAVRRYWKLHGRHDLPWRRTHDPYKILVSEFMLQQTQVSRVLEKYVEFLREFPDVQTLAKASLSDVLKVWNGLGYNRRAKFLLETARAIVRDHGGKVPKDLVSLRTLPGMGPYTASAVRVFAFDLPDVLIETNVRAVFIHSFFANKSGVHDEQLLPYIHEAAAGQDPREWHWALMDYGVHLKKIHQNPTRNSRHYVVQTKFEGSLRQVRGAILKLLKDDMYGDRALAHELSLDEKRVRDALFALAKDGLVVAERGAWRIT